MSLGEAKNAMGKQKKWTEARSVTMPPSRNGVKKLWVFAVKKPARHVL
jgi:hypothetical protein